MKQAYIILGYGVPKNITRDFNYQLYLRAVFNMIYQEMVEKNIQPVVIPSGGPTDLFKPYRRTEAGQMVRELRRLTKALPRRFRSAWSFIAEPLSFSTLENLQFTKKYARRFRQVTIFCEITRTRRIQQFARLVYGRGIRVRVVGIDFDVTANRYSDPKLLRKKEKVFSDFDRWALRSPANMRRHHELYVEKIRRFRQKKTSKEHIRLVGQWFNESMKAFETIRKTSAA